MLSALKNIQAKTVKKNVLIICKNSRTEGIFLCWATIFKYFLLLFVSKSGKKYIAFNAPHTIKVQFAPCQKPLAIKMIKVFLIFFNLPPLLPPSGIYR